MRESEKSWRGKNGFKKGDKTNVGRIGNNGNGWEKGHIPWNAGTHGIMKPPWNKGMTLKGKPEYKDYLAKLSAKAQARAMRQKRQLREAELPRPNSFHYQEGIWGKIKGAFGIV